MENKMNKRSQVQLVGFTVGEEQYQTTIPAKYQNRKPYQAPNPKMITSFMPGTIQEVYVSEGEKISTTTRLCILEAMKMKNIIFSQEGGIIKKINVKPGQLVPKGCVLVELV